MKNPNSSCERLRFVCRPYHVRVKPSRHASDRAAFKRVRTPHARPSVLKEPCAKSSCADANPTRGSDPSQGGLPFEHTGSRRARAPRPGRTALAGRGTRADRRRVAALVPTERRSGEERRTGAERRTPESVAEHIRNALQLLTNVAESGTLDEESLRDLDAAMFRLRFALDRFEARQ